MSMLLDSLLWALKVHFPYPSLLGESNSPSRVSLSLNFSCSNFRQRSLYGFRSSTLIGWLGGDAFKYIPILLHRILRLIICKGLGIFFGGEHHSNSKFVPYSSFQLTLVCLSIPSHPPSARPDPLITQLSWYRE